MVEIRQLKSFVPWSRQMAMEVQQGVSAAEYGHHKGGTFNSEGTLMIEK